MNPYTTIYLMNKTPESLERDAENCHKFSKSKTFKIIIGGLIVVICALAVIAIIV